MKKVLFAIDSIGCGGAERGLFALLNALDYKKYDVDLLYFSRENEYYKDSIPSEVKVIQPDPAMELIVSSVSYLVHNLKDVKLWPVSLRRLVYGIGGKLKPGDYYKRRAHDWKKLSRYVPELQKDYDVAIAYMGTMTRYYTMEKVRAKRYITWQRTDYKLTGCDPALDVPYYGKADAVCVLSEEMKKNFAEVFPELREKIVVAPNIFDVEGIRKKAQEDVAFATGFDGYKIVSVGTLRQVKGYDVAMRACRRLKDAGYNFKWFVIGSGEERGKMEEDIKRLNLENAFILLGNKRNPYTYVARSDIYVQCSYREGLSSTVFEAKCLKKPIVVTAAPGMKDQIEDGVNGFVVPIGSDEDVAKAIAALFDSSSLRESFSNALQAHIDIYENDVQEKLEQFDHLTDWN